MKTVFSKEASLFVAKIPGHHLLPWLKSREQLRTWNFCWSGWLEMLWLYWNHFHVCLNITLSILFPIQFAFLTRLGRCQILVHLPWAWGLACSRQEAFSFSWFEELKMVTCIIAKDNINESGKLSRSRTGKTIQQFAPLQYRKSGEIKSDPPMAAD